MDISYENLLLRAKEQVHNLVEAEQGYKIQVVISKEVADMSITSTSDDNNENIIYSIENYTDENIVDLKNAAKEIAVDISMIFEIVDLTTLNN